MVGIFRLKSLGVLLRVTKRKGEDDDCKGFRSNKFEEASGLLSFGLIFFFFADIPSPSLVTTYLKMQKCSNPLSCCDSKKMRTLMLLFLTTESSASLGVFFEMYVLHSTVNLGLSLLGYY